MKTRNQKAVLMLQSYDVAAREGGSTVYLVIDEMCFELSRHEIDYQARQYDFLTNGYHVSNNNIIDN